MWISHSRAISRIYGIDYISWDVYTSMSCVRLHVCVRVHYMLHLSLFSYNHSVGRWSTSSDLRVVSMAPFLLTAGVHCTGRDDLCIDGLFKSWWHSSLVFLCANKCKEGAQGVFINILAPKACSYSCCILYFNNNTGASGPYMIKSQMSIQITAQVQPCCMQCSSVWTSASIRTYIHDRVSSDLIAYHLPISCTAYSQQSALSLAVIASWYKWRLRPSTHLYTLGQNSTTSFSQSSISPMNRNSEPHLTQNAVEHTNTEFSKS